MVLPANSLAFAMPTACTVNELPHKMLRIAHINFCATAGKLGCLQNRKQSNKIRETGKCRVKSGASASDATDWVLEDFL